MHQQLGKSGHTFALIIPPELLERHRNAIPLFSDSLGHTEFRRSHAGNFHRVGFSGIWVREANPNKTCFLDSWCAVWFFPNTLIYLRMWHIQVKFCKWVKDQGLGDSKIFCLNSHLEVTFEPLNIKLWSSFLVTPRGGNASTQQTWHICLATWPDVNKLWVHFQIRRAAVHRTWDNISAMAWCIVIIRCLFLRDGASLIAGCICISKRNRYSWPKDLVVALSLFCCLTQ